jgi:uncharacterized cupredoxin-like copper-binding protein
MKRINRLLAVSLIAIGSVAFANGDHGHGHASALGQPGDPKKVTRTVEITMSDAMRFSPASVSVKRNETIRFVLSNVGKLKHEMVLGTAQELKEHAALMRKFPEMEHADPNQASVEPGKAGALVWQFTKAGTFDFACLQVGHYEAGMKGQVVVAGTATPDHARGTLIAQSGTTDMADGEVRKVDKDTKKITITHGEIKNLDMPGMTMLFQVKDPAMLDMVKPGDKVKFRAEKAGGGIMVTEIQVAK